MSDQGYTLTETLAAMAVIGLAIGGFSQGMQTIGLGQSAVIASVLKTEEPRAAQAWLERTLAERGPYRTHEPERLTGTADRFRFDCGAAAPCSVELSDEAGGRRLKVFRGAGPPSTYRLPGPEPARFVYRGLGSAASSWPPQGGEREALSSISLLQGQGRQERVVLVAHLRSEEPVDCRFDTVMRDCR